MLTSQQLYQIAVDELAEYRQASKSDIYLDQYVSNNKEFQKYNDAGHGYLIVLKTSPYYLKALEVFNNSGFGYKLQGSIALEEDCEMYTFLKAI